MDINKAVNILKQIKLSLLKEYPKDNSTDTKISALDAIIRFSQKMNKLSQTGFIRKALEENSAKNNDLLEKILEKHIDNDKLEFTEEPVEKIYSNEIKLKFNHKLAYSMIKYKNDKYIIIEPRIYNKKMDKWINWQAYEFPIALFKEEEFKSRFKE